MPLQHLVRPEVMAAYRRSNEKYREPYASLSRTFYIRFAKITVRKALRAGRPTASRYNVFRYQVVSASTGKPVLASDL